MRADELAAVARETVAAGGADLTMVIDWSFHDPGFKRKAWGRL